MKKPSPRLWLALLTLLVIAASVAILQRETTQQISAASQPGAVFHTEAVVSSVGSDAEAPSTVDAKAPSAAPAVPLFNAPGATIGTRLNPKGAAYMQARLDGKTVKGRMAPLELRSFGGLPAVQVGETVRLPLIDGEAVEGVVNFAETNSRGWTRVAGSLTGNKRGSFVLATTAKKASGLIQLPDEQLAYEIVTHPDGQLMMHERLLSEVICSPLPWPREEEGRKAARAPVPQGAPPILSSRPDAEGVLYLDFDGETVTDPAWNDGRTIVAAAARMTAAQITDVWNRVKEDFLAFNVDVTTNEERYNQAPVGKRMRCIITPTNSFYKNAGGVAYLGSFAEAGFGFYSETIPCWVFIDNNTKACAEAVSHEFGHTFDLSHDGRTSPFTEYYEGHGSGSTGWAPIMGVGYYRELVQWSRGEYTGANRTQDDIAIIAGPQNDIGFAPDEAGGAIDSAMPVETDNGDILQRGVISQASDADFYIFNTTGGTATINAVPAPTSPNVDLLIEVQDGSGTVVSRANPPDALNSALSTTLPAGTYYLKVQGIGKGDVKDGGYSSYGSVGAYTLSGSVPGLFRRPIVTNLSRVLGRIDEPFSLQITARNAPTSYGVSGSLPPGVTLDPTTGLMTGIATVAGRYDVVLIATNEFGDGSKPVTITISPGLIPLGEAADATDLPWTSTTPEWLGQAFVTHDGVDAVESPELGNSQESRLQATVVGPATVTFRWKVSSQEGADFLGFAIDGNTLTRISGNVDWQLRSFVVPSGSHTLRWIYRKDAQAAEGQDRGWVDTVTLGPLQKPVITSSPAVASQVGVPFTYLIAAENSPTSYAVVGALPAGLGLDSATGVISGTPTSPGNFNITMKAISQIGTGTAALRISVAAAVVAIADAVDAPGLMWSTGGDGPWFGQIATTYDIADAAQSADIADAQQTWIETTAQGPSTVTFRWKVDSEAGFDFLRFTIDGVEQTAISGETDWRQESFLVPAGSHTLRWNYVKDAGASFGADKGWVDTVIVTTAVVPVVTNSRNATGRVGNAVDFRINATNEPTVYGVTGDLPPGLTVNTVTGVITGVPAREGTYNITLTAANDAGTGTKEVVFFVEPSLISIAQAVDSTTAAWTTGGDTPWFGQNAVAHDGVDAAQSGRIAHSEESTLVTQITGPTVIRFSWRVSSEQDFDVLAFLIDETVQSTLSGITGWVQRTFSIPEGTHTLKWRYRKDSSVSAGDDSAWLDRVSTGSTTIPVITSAGQVSATVEQPFNYQTVATNSPTGYSASGLPVGLVLNTSSGRITGTPEALGRSEVTLNASNVNGTGSITLIIDVVPPVPAITSVQTTQAQLATPFNYQITATLNPTSFGAIGLPPGLQLDPDTGLITGTPTVKGTFQVTLSATNADGTGTRTLLIAIGASVPVLTFERSPEGEVGVPFSLWLSASSNPLGFSVSGLPVGLRLDGATGVISGVPVVAGTYEITATANNRNGIGTLAFQINIAPADPQMLVGSDTFTSPGELRGASVTITDNNSDATAEESEPAHSGNAPAKSLWWRWTAPLAGPVRISTVGSTFDTVLAVYQEQEWGLMLVTANDNASAGLTSSAAQFTAAKGQAYLIAVDGVAGAIGDVNLSIRYEATATYAGILSVPGKSSLPAGAISVTTTADGSFTGRVALNRGNASFKGQFGVDGKATVTATGKGQTLPVSLALDVTTGTSTLGSSVNFGGETYAAIAQRSGFSLSVPTTLVGDHTLLMEPASAGSGRPFSTGFAVMKIESTGRVTLVGTLADGVRFSQSTVLADDGTFPLFAAPYRSGGAISGSVALGESPRRALSGALHWLKKPDSARNATYSSGFEMQSRLAGGAYVSVAPVLNLGGFGTISFLASNLAVPPPQQIALSIENKVRTSSGAGYPMKIDAKRGLFSGSFTSGGGKRSFKGAFLQGEQRAAGLFISNGATGVVNLVPSAAPASLKP